MNTPQKLGRRAFLKNSIAVSLAAPMVMSVEEHRLLAQEAGITRAPAGSGRAATLPTGTIGKVKMSRLLCGGNLISGYAHSRDLIYVSSLLKHYFTDERIMDTWALCERHGIDTMILNPEDRHAVEVYRKYRGRGGKIQFLAQISPKKEEIKETVQLVVDAGAIGAFLVGNLGDAWTRDGSVGLVAETVKRIKDHGVIAGVAGHEVRTPMTVEKAKIDPDFYVKTLHSANYWSKRQPGQDKDVIDNYGIDNYWCKDPDETIRFMAEIEKPWIAYKVLAAGAIHPRAGFQHAFANGADFLCVGMFDFQVAENVAVANQILSGKLDRQREWMA